MTLIIVALIMVALLVIAALVLDFGLARSDKQASKSAGDSAVAAGLRALQNPDGIPRPFEGVCEAIRYLKVNDSDFADLSGTLKAAEGNDPTPIGIAAGTTDPCATTPAPPMDRKCEPNKPETWAWFDGTANGGNVKVDIRSGYDLDDPDFPDEGSSSDAGAPEHGGCDQIAVIISHTRGAGFGSVAGAGDLTTRARSVGRVTIGQDADAAVALVLLEQTDCGALNMAGQAGEVIVRGTLLRPGMIHADSDGSDCKNNEWIIEGANDSGANPLVRALSAPSAGNPPVPPNHGILSTYARFLDPSFDRDASWTNLRSNNSTHVWMCDPDNGLPVINCEVGPTGADRITRRPADDRYNGALQALREDANQVASGVTTYDHDPNNSEPPESGRYLRYQSLGHGCNNPTATITSAELPTGKLYVDCSSLSISNNQFLDVAVDNVEVVFAGSISISNGGRLRLDDPRRTYVASGISNGGDLDLNRSGEDDCLAKNNDPDARLRTHELVIQNGGLASSGGGAIRICSTFVHLMGGSTTVDPINQANYPNPYHNDQSGAVNISGGGSIQWTAPNTTAAPPSGNTYEFEDLALWTEASRHQSNPRHRLGGDGKMDLVGVFVLPNADELRIEGGSSGEIDADAQMWTRRLRRIGGAHFEMRADPAQSILVPFFEGFELVR